MAGFPFDIVGFDLDGTLLDTGDDLTAATSTTRCRSPVAARCRGRRRCPMSAAGCSS
ncbi:hypothetical protein AB5I41_27275 [Sphingomonas sp. MMS24-JH45]